MKKILLSVLTTFTVVGVASAVPTPEQRRAMCDQNSKTVWVEKTSACVPENTCQSNNEDIKAAYCYAGFRLTSVPEASYAHRLVDVFIKRQNNGDRCTKIGEAADWKKSGSTYIKCNTEDGMYYVFEFDTIMTDRAQSADAYYASGELSTIFEALCERIHRGRNMGRNDIRMARGQPSAIPDLAGTSFLCKDVSQNTCDNLAEDTSEVFNQGWRAVYHEQQDKAGTITKLCGITKM